MAQREARGRDLSAVPLAELFRLDGKVAVVTGGARGMGRAICERLAEAGAAVLVADIDVEAAEAAAAEIGEQHAARVLGTRLDVEQRSSVEAAAALAETDLGPIDIWVNNAGIYPQPNPLAVDDAEFERIFRINVLGTQFGIEAASSRMIPSGRPGCIVNIASTAAFRGAGPYSASKWAVRGLTHGLAGHLGPHGIRVVGLAPTITETPGMAALAGSGDVDFLESVAAGIPLGRAGAPDDIARAAVFVASDAGSFITAATLVVDGGSLAALS